MLLKNKSHYSKMRNLRQTKTPNVQKSETVGKKQIQCFKNTKLSQKKQNQLFKNAKLFQKNKSNYKKRETVAQETTHVFQNSKLS